MLFHGKWSPFRENARISRIRKSLFREIFKMSMKNNVVFTIIARFSWNLFFFSKCLRESYLCKFFLCEICLGKIWLFSTRNLFSRDFFSTNFSNIFCDELVFESFFHDEPVLVSFFRDQPFFHEFNSRVHCFCKLFFS